MAYDELLAARVRAARGPEPGLAELMMFGGISFTVHGHLACGVVQDDRWHHLPQNRFIS